MDLGGDSGVDLLGDYQVYCTAAGHSDRTIRLRLHWLRRAAREIDLGRATRPELLTWLARHDWRPETRKSARSALRSFYSWAEDDGRLPVNPAARLPPVRVPAGMPRPTPDPLVHRALKAATDRDRIIIGLATLAGLRCSEIAALPWSAVQWPGLRVVGKGGRTRVVPIHAELRPLLADEQERRNRGQTAAGWRFAVDPASDYVLPSHLGGHMSHYTVSKILSRALGPGWSGHTLRHRFLTQAYAVERDLLAVQQLAGHSSPETTAGYVEVPYSAMARAVAGVAA